MQQLKIAEGKGRNSVDEFRVGDKVILQDIQTKKWNIPGKVVKEREADDGQLISFVVQTESGQEFLRHKRFMKHKWPASDEPEPKRVKFADKPDADTTEKKAGAEPSIEGSQPVRPRRSPRLNNVPKDVPDPVHSLDHHSLRLRSTEPQVHLPIRKRKGGVPTGELPKRRKQSN